jgi:hypothetical protein
MTELVGNLGLAIIAAILAALLTYIFTVVVTRKGTMHDAKLEAYARIVGLYQESLTSLETISRLQEFKASPETIGKEMVSLSTELTMKGDIETMSLFSDSQKASEAISARGGEAGFVAWLRDRAILLSSRKMADNLNEVTFRGGQLALVRPTPRIRDALDAVHKTFAVGNAIVLQKLDNLSPGAASLIEVPKQLVAKPKKEEKWLKDNEKALLELVVAMDEDLRRTLSWRRL